MPSILALMPDGSLRIKRIRGQIRSVGHLVYPDHVEIFRQTRQEYDFPTMFSVEAQNGGSLAWGPVTLTLVSCLDLVSGESCSQKYE